MNVCLLGKLDIFCVAVDDLEPSRVSKVIAPEPFFGEEFMRMSRIGFAVLLVVLFANGKFALASEQEDKEMNDLAKASGCYLCHSVESRKPRAQEILPFGPAWKDVGKRHKGQADAVDRLTRIVLQGTGQNLSDRHWKGKAEGVAMLPNAVEINEADARKLVRWILSFDK